MKCSFCGDSVTEESLQCGDCKDRLCNDCKEEVTPQPCQQCHLPICYNCSASCWRCGKESFYHVNCAYDFFRGAIAVFCPSCRSQAKTCSICSNNSIRYFMIQNLTVCRLCMKKCAN